MIGANWAVTNAVTSVVTSAPRHGNRLTHCHCMRLLLSPMSPIETPETLENAKKKRKRRMTHQFTLNFNWRDWAAGTQGCETFEIAAQHPRGYHGVFYGETALTICRQSQLDEVLTRERPQQPRSGIPCVARLRACS